MLKGFRDFILRGNVVDLAVAVIIGAAFNSIVASLVGDILNPLIAATVGKPDFSYVIMNLHGHDQDRQLPQRRRLVSYRGRRGLFRHCSALECVPARLKKPEPKRVPRKPAPNA